jgi:SAM-dependent methyltransferase
MYSEKPARDVLRFLRASFTNLLAAVPFYLRVGDRSGRGQGAQAPALVSDYFRRCVDDYLAELAVDASFLRGKRVLEYGPGDALGVALRLYAHGAASVHAVDHFPLHRITPRTAAIYRAILDSLDGEARARGERAFVEPGNPLSGFDPSAIEYRVTPHGLARRPGEYDLVLSRSVLALVGRLDATIADIASALKPGGVSIHKVDLSSHGLDREHKFDFLTWPSSLYRLMYSRKGRPNRWRVDRYQALAAGAGLRVRKLSPTGRIADDELAFIAPRVDPMFRALPPDELAWLGFWMVLDRG